MLRGSAPPVSKEFIRGNSPTSTHQLLKTEPVAIDLGSAKPRGEHGSVPARSWSRRACNGIARHDRGFQPPRYLGIGRWLVAVEHFNAVKANTI